MKNDHILSKPGMIQKVTFVDPKSPAKTLLEDLGRRVAHHVQQGNGTAAERLLNISAIEFLSMVIEETST